MGGSEMNDMGDFRYEVTRNILRLRDRIPSSLSAPQVAASMPCVTREQQFRLDVTEKTPGRHRNPLF